MTKNEILKEIDNLITWINVRRNAPLILSDYGSDIAIKALNQWKEYQELGTVEELRKAMEKQKPKKPKDSKLGYLYSECPNCSCGLFSWGNDYTKYSYCMECGQKLDFIDWDLERLERIK